MKRRQKQSISLGAVALMILMGLFLVPPPAARAGRPSGRRSSKPAPAPPSFDRSAVSIFLAGPEARFNHLTVENGLSNGTVTAILQDRLGFVWIGTLNGLNQYDGYRFKAYHHDPENLNSLRENEVRSLAEDANGTIWIVYQKGGFSSYDPEREAFTHYPEIVCEDGEALPNTAFVVAADSKSTSVWFALENGLARYDVAEKRFFNHPHNMQSLNDMIIGLEGLEPEDDGTVWMTTKNGLARYDPVLRRAEWFRAGPNESAGPAGNLFRRMDRDEKGRLWIGSASTGLVGFDPAAKRFSEAVGLNDITLVAAGSNGVLWLAASDRGLYRYDPERGKAVQHRRSPSDSGSLNSDSILTLFEDREGLIWIGTKGDGINIYNPAQEQFGRHVRDPNNPKSLNNNEIMAVYKDRLGIVWAGTDGGGLNRYDPREHSWSSVSPPPEMRGSDPFDWIFAICESRGGGFWVSSGEKIYLFDAETGTFLRALGETAGVLANQETLLTCMEDRKGDLWIGTRFSGLIRVAKGEESLVRSHPFSGKEAPLGSDRVDVLYEDSKGNVWVGAPNGLARYDREKVAFVPYLREGEAISVFSIAEDPSDGKLWLGAPGGLCLFEPVTGSYGFIAKGRGLPTANVANVRIDAKGNIWFSSGAGLTRFDPQSGEHLTFDVSDGLLSNEFLAAHYDSQEDEMYYGGTNGLNVFRPERILRNDVPPPVRLTDFRVFNRAVPFGDDLFLKHPVWLMAERGETLKLAREQSVLSFEFAALSFAAPHRNRCRYKLEGLEEEWNEVGASRRFVTYTNLPVGRYVFRVQGANNSGKWSEKEARLKMEMTPPWWETVWFKTLAGMFLVLAGPGVYMWRMRAVRSRNALLESLVAQRTRELEKKSMELEERTEELGVSNDLLQNAIRSAESANEAKSRYLAFMSHELRTPLNAILGHTQIFQEDAGLMREKGKAVNAIHRGGEHLLSIINDILDLSKIEAGKLELTPIRVAFGHFLTGLTETFEPRAALKNIELRYVPDADLPAGAVFDDKRLRQTLFNLLGNAVKFTDRGRVEFRVRKLSRREENGAAFSRVRFEVFDTGPGLSPENASKLFTPFQQAGDRASKAQGTGLGLSISKRIVELMGGELHVESEEGKGSLFWFDLDLEGAKIAKPADPSRKISGYEGPRRRLLIVDDVEHNREILKGMLSPLGFELEEAADGEEGLTKALGGAFDLALLDLAMPRMSGHELIARLRQSDAWGARPAVAVSASVDAGTRKEASKEGFDGFLNKPVILEELLGVLQRELALTWIHPDEESAPGPAGEAVESGLQLPPDAELQVVLDAARKNQYSALIAEIERLRLENGKWSEFAAKLDAMTRAFQFKKIVQWLEATAREGIDPDG